MNEIELSNFTARVAVVSGRTFAGLNPDAVLDMYESAVGDLPYDLRLMQLQAHVDGGCSSAASPRGWSRPTPSSTRRWPRAPRASARCPWPPASAASTGSAAPSPTCTPRSADARAPPPLCPAASARRTARPLVRQGSTTRHR